MEHVNRLGSCKFEPLVETAVPEKAVVWCKQNYYDGSGWVGLADHERLSLKPTLFADKRLLFLEPTEGVCDCFKAVQSGKYDVKCWSKGENYIGIEGDKSVFLLTPVLKEVAVYVHSERLPAFPKTWKPLLFNVNDSVVTFRLTDTVCLVVTIDESRTVKVQCVDYNGGFVACHPATDVALAYGAMAVKGFDALPKCCSIPRIPCSSGDWGFFVQFYPWGSLVTPKALDLERPTAILGVGLGKKVDLLGVLFHPPNMVLNVHLESPKAQRSLQYGKDYLLTAIKSSETDLDLYLIMDGQLVKYNHSFDIRVNKPGKPKHVANVAFKCTVEVDDKKKPTRFNFTSVKHAEVLVSQGSPLSEGDHLVSSQLISVFDAEICMYMTHPPALKLCNAFTTVALPVE